TVLGYARSLRMLARLTSDDLRDGLKRYPEPNEAPAFLRPSAIKALLRAALDHDADTFRLTRAENAVGRSRPQGVTPRHEPIAPYVATVLLSGMRSGEAHGRGARARRTGEAHGLDWSEVELAGEGTAIHLPARRAKTKHARVAALDVSPRPADL